MTQSLKSILQRLGLNVSQNRAHDDQATYRALVLTLIAFVVINAAYQILAVFFEDDPFTLNYFVTLASMLAGGLLFVRLRRYQYTQWISYALAAVFLIEQTCDVLFDSPDTMLPNMLWFIAVVAIAGLTRSLFFTVACAVYTAVFLGLVWNGAIDTASILSWRERDQNNSLFGAYLSMFVVGGGFVLAETFRGSLLSQQRVHLAATRDSLTGLLNRNCLEQDLAFLFDAYEQRNKNFALIFADLDHFKQINDLWGHNLGDKVLADVGGRIESACARADVPSGGDLSPYRHGGDEFVIVASWNPDSEWLNRFLVQLAEEVEQPYYLEDDISVEICISFGLAFSHQQARSVRELLHYADIAMYAAKRAGDRLGKHNQKTHDEVWTRQFDVFSGLQDCVEKRELSLVYQPIYAASSGSMVKLEALLRWHSPKLNAVSPAEFIAIAEASGIITKITYWVIEEAHRQLAGILDQHRDLELAINLSPFSLQSPDFLHELRRRLAASKVDRSRLVFEITETSPILNNRAIENTLREVRLMGFQLSLDDYGCGDSSLLSLRNGAFSEIKLDRSLVMDALVYEPINAIVNATILSAQAIGLKVVAEGIETEDHAAHMRQLNCDYLQGYHFSKPLPLEALGLIGADQSLPQAL